MGCTASRRKPVLAPNGKQPDSNPSNSDKASLKNSTNSSTGSGKKDVKDDKKGDVSESKPGSQTDISRLLTEKEVKPEETKEKKLKTLEEKSAKIPSVEPSTEGDKRSQEKDAIGKTPSTDDKLPCATPLKDGQKLQPPKPDNGEYINFNDVLSDEFSEDEDDKKKEKKDGKKEEKKKEGKKEGKKEEKKEEKKEDKKEKEKEKEKPKEKSKEKDQKVAKPKTPAVTTAPKHEKPKSKNKSARSVDGKGEKKKKDEGNGVKKADGMKMHETKDAVKKMRTGAVRSRQAPHEDTLYQVPHRMPEVDFTKLHCADR